MSTESRQKMSNVSVMAVEEQVGILNQNYLIVEYIVVRDCGPHNRGCKYGRARLCRPQSLTHSLEIMSKLELPPIECENPILDFVRSCFTTLPHTRINFKYYSANDGHIFLSKTHSNLLMLKQCLYSLG